MHKTKRTKVFISYSHKDIKWLERLCVHLKPLERDNKIEIWADTRITPGSKWKIEIKNALESAKVAILLVSADFLASDFIATDELPLLLNAAENQGAKILPVILKPCGFLRARILSQFQTINDPSKPLSLMSGTKREAVFADVAEQINKLLVSQPRSQDSKDREPTRTKPKSVHKPKSPKFHAEFVLNRRGKPRIVDESYEIRLFIMYAPPDTQYVMYTLYEYDEDEDVVCEVQRGTPDFEEYITSYGDFEIGVTIYGRRSWKFKMWLSKALELNYGRNRSEAVQDAIDDIEDN